MEEVTPGPFSHLTPYLDLDSLMPGNYYRRMKNEWVMEDLMNYIKATYAQRPLAFGVREELNILPKGHPEVSAELLKMTGWRSWGDFIQSRISRALSRGVWRYVDMTGRMLKGCDLAEVFERKRTEHWSPSLKKREGREPPYADQWTHFHFMKDPGPAEDFDFSIQPFIVLELDFILTKVYPIEWKG